MNNKRGVYAVVIVAALGLVLAIVYFSSSATSAPAVARRANVSTMTSERDLSDDGVSGPTTHVQDDDQGHTRLSGTESAAGSRASDEPESSSPTKPKRGQPRKAKPGGRDNTQDSGGEQDEQEDQPVKRSTAGLKP